MISVDADNHMKHINIICRGGGERWTYLWLQQVYIVVISVLYKAKRYADSNQHSSHRSPTPTFDPTHCVQFILSQPNS
jgi:hypothetical protein